MTKVYRIIAIFFAMALFFQANQALACLYPTKDNLGLNVHWALGGFGLDNLYNKRLDESKTKWVREHFYTEVFHTDNYSWPVRYEEILKKYKSKGINIVGMLAYGPEHGNFMSPDPRKWEAYVDYMVRRYGKYVKVWEVWNEPDSPTYLKPNTADNYIPILNIAYKRIKKLDPNAKVLAAGMATPNPGFAEELYSKTDNFDALSFHLYYCGYYRDVGNHDKLKGDLEELKKVIQKYNGEKAWVTELGCSTGMDGVDQNFQKIYLDEASRIVLDTGFIEKVFIYNIRNYDFRGVYEDNFGLLTKDMKLRRSWDWYKGVPIGPYNKERLYPDQEQQKAVELKHKLEYYFGEGLIPVSAVHWPKFVSAYIYGGYSVQAIVQAIRYGGKTVHTEIPFEYWQARDEYKEYINKDWTGGMIIHAYNKPRMLITEEAKKAEDLKIQLCSNYDISNLGITPENWNMLFTAYAYGGYPIAAIANYSLCNGSVSSTVPYENWRGSTEYISCMN